MLSDHLNLTYIGEEQEPAVSVTLDGTKLTAEDYNVTYANNINAGINSAVVTVIGQGNYSFEAEKTFSIEKAEQKDFAVKAVTMQFEKNGTFTLTATGGNGDGAILYRVPENNGVLMVSGNKATMIGGGAVAVTATKAESANYKEATATAAITITKAPAPAITYPKAGSITYGQELSDSILAGGSTEYGSFAWKDGSTPQNPVTSPVDRNTNPGNETALGGPGAGTIPMNPGSRNMTKPGTNPDSRNTAKPGTSPGSAGTSAWGTKQPFIKGEDGKIGWDVIRAGEECSCTVKKQATENKR